MKYECSSSDLGTNHPVSYGELGNNDYLEWGYWNAAGKFEIKSDYAVNHPDNERQGYYIFGPNPADIGALEGTYNYTGDAYGTLYYYTTNKAMEGTFSCTLGFGTTPTVSNFGLYVSGGGYEASIAGASGTLSTKDNHIDLDYKSGTWQLGMTGSSVGATCGDVKGSVYGSNGEAVGGVWNMGNTNDEYHATGIFRGAR